MKSITSGSVSLKADKNTGVKILKATETHLNS